MEGDRLLKVRFLALATPGGIGQGESFTLREVTTWGRIQYGTGNEREERDTVVSLQAAVIVVRQIGIETLSTSCEIDDDTGRTWRVISVTEPPGLQRGVWWRVNVEEVS